MDGEDGWTDKKSTDGRMDEEREGGALGRPVASSPGIRGRPVTIPRCSALTWPNWAARCSGIQAPSPRPLISAPYFTRASMTGMLPRCSGAFARTASHFRARSRAGNPNCGCQEEIQLYLRCQMKAGETKFVREVGICGLVSLSILAQ